MQSVYGKVIEILRDPIGRVNGFVLESGYEARSSADQPDLLAAIITLDSRVEISGDLQSGGEEAEILNATQITNLDSKRTASLQAAVCLRKPGMLSDGAPNRSASLAHIENVERSRPTGTISRGEGNADPIRLLLEKKASQRRSSRYDSEEDPQGGHVSPTRAVRAEAATEIEHAFDSLHRIQAILAYLNIMKRQVRGMSQMHEEAKHTYEQALARHTERDFEGAREFAAASECLSRVVEGVISRMLRADTTYPSLVSPPPEHKSTSGESSPARDDLGVVFAVLSRVHWLMANGTLPLEDLTQVRRIASWSDAFYQQARRLFQHGSHEDAAELAQSALDAARSAEHICRNWYVAHASDPHLHTIPSEIVRRKLS